MVDEEKVIGSLKKILNRFNKNEVAMRVECRGEITLYQRIINYLENKAKEGYCIEILSNGLLLANVLEEHTNMHCVVSLDGHNKRMNQFRKLNQQQVDTILDNIFRYKAEIQSVILGQTTDEINEFIQYLIDRDFNTRLHLFPCSIKGKLISKSLDYQALKQADFLPPKEYFYRWQYILENQKRDFVCDFFKNGYTYYIYNKTIEMMKCDGTPNCHDFRVPFGEEQHYKEYPCGTCINHNEYNNSRSFINTSGE